jgi:hypothetical protein
MIFGGIYLQAFVRKYQKNKRSKMSRKILIAIFDCIVMLLIITIFAISVGAVKDVKISYLKGGEQYWWQAEDFDDRDAAVFVLSGENGSNVPDLKGAYGGDYIVHNTPNPAAAVEGKDFVKYLIAIKNGGAYYIWARSSWDRTAGGRANNSFWVQVNGQPLAANFQRWVDNMGDANWLDNWDEENPWTWIGDSAKPQDLQGLPGGGITNGLKKDFKAGENTFMIYHREGAADNQTLCTDMLMISTVDFAPTDADYEKSGAPVELSGKLATTWAQLKAGKGKNSM